MLRVVVKVVLGVVGGALLFAATVTVATYLVYLLTLSV